MILTANDINEMLSRTWPATKVRCLEVNKQEALAIIKPLPDQLRPGGFISGPTQFGLADAALWFLSCGVLGRAEPMVLTSELSIRYLRPAQGQKLYGKATLARAGKRDIVGSVAIWVDEKEHKPTAIAQGTYRIHESFLEGT